MKRKMISVLIALVMTISLSIPVSADTLIADGDGLTPVSKSSSSLNLGSVEAGKSVSGTVLLAISRNGQGKSATNVFANNSTVTVISSSSNSNLNLSMIDNTINIPSNWNVYDNNIMTDSIEGLGVGTSSSKVILTVPKGTAPGVYSENILYTATGNNSAGEMISPKVDVTVYYTVIAPADTTAPVVTATPDRSANESGWYNKDVTVSFSATDPESTVTSVDGPKTVSTEGKDQVISGSATNSAGLTGTGSTTISIDKTAPTISGSTDSEANAAGWYNKDVTVSFDASDALSGVATVTEPVVLCEGKDQSVIGTAIDRARNDASTTVSGINIDETVPTINGSTDRIANAEGWYNSDVTVSFNATDALSGVATVTEPVVLGEGKNQSVTGTATDKAGNNESATVSGINIDKTEPVITVENGGTYLLNQNVTWTATDALSGLKTAANGTIDTSKVGLHTTTIKAADNAGNTKEVEITYTVKYDFSGILQPINSNGSSIFKAGSTVPVKFQLKDSSGTFVSTASATLSYVNITSNILGTEAEAVSTSAATTGNLFRYDSTANQYIFNFSTKGLTAGTYQLNIKLDDSKTYTVRISLK